MQQPTDDQVRGKNRHVIQQNRRPLAATTRHREPLQHCRPAEVAFFCNPELSTVTLLSQPETSHPLGNCLPTTPRNLPDTVELMVVLWV